MKSVILPLFLMSGIAFAEPIEIVGFSETESQINLAQVQEQITLVQSQRGDSDLRVSLVVADMGGSTDVSPAATLYLTTFNQSEMRDAYSVHRISHIQELLNVRRVAPGQYQALVRMYDFESACGPQSAGTTEKLIDIDARTLTAAVRRFEGVPEFGRSALTNPIYVDFTCQ